MTSPDVLVDDGNLCGECPIWDAEALRLYWTDSAGRQFFSYDWKTRQRQIILDRFEVNGCALHEGGGLVLANGSGIWYWDATVQPILLANELHDAELGINDCIADRCGRFLAGSCFYSTSSEYPLGKLFSVHVDGTIEVLDEGFHLANGLGFSPDGRTLYFTDSVARQIYAYDYDPATGRTRNRRLFVSVDTRGGLPDGLTVDAEGFVWSAEWYGSRICRYDPDGSLERRIPVPAKQTSSLAFGGPELCDLFVTSAARSEPTPVMPPGYDAQSGYFGGALFHIHLDIPGRPEYRTRIKIPAHSGRQ